VPETLVRGRLPEGLDDDVAVLVARVDVPEAAHRLRRVYESGDVAVGDARHRVAEHLRSVGLGEDVVDDAVLVTSELITNALLHAAPPLELRVTGDEQEVRIEVHDRTSYVPRKQRPTADDEHGRGLQIVAALADRWGTRPTDSGKAVWCVLGAAR
jgi:anti-sigma regulatory factor (Ser/Thr protein kinase)